MGDCVTKEGRTARSREHDSVIRSVPTKIGTIGNNYDYEDNFSRSRANAPSTSSLNDSNYIVSNLNECENNLLIHKHRRTMTNPISPAISEIAMSPRKKSSIWSDSSLHNQIKVNKYYKNSIDYASGQFAQIFMTNLDKNNTKQTRIVIKKIKIGDLNHLINTTTKKSAENELKILKLCNGHQNIVGLVDSFYEIEHTDLYLNLVMEFIPITLKNEISKYKSLDKRMPFKLIQIYSYQILKGINYMNHVKNVIHRDLKPENILINPLTNEVKICDFRCAKHINNETETLSMLNVYVCSRYYRAPELLLQSNHYSYEIDMWSFGCILCELFLAHILFNGANTSDQMKQIMKVFGLPTKKDCIAMNKCYEYDQLLDIFGNVKCDTNNNWQFVFDGIKDMPINVMDLIGKILRYNPNERLYPFNAMKHKYFQDLKQNNRDCQHAMPFAMFDFNDEENKLFSFLNSFLN